MISELYFICIRFILFYSMSDRIVGNVSYNHTFIYSTWFIELFKPLYKSIKFQHFSLPIDAPIYEI